MVFYRQFVEPEFGKLAQSLALERDWIMKLYIKGRYAIAESKLQFAVLQVIDVFYFARSYKLQLFSKF